MAKDSLVSEHSCQLGKEWCYRNCMSWGAPRKCRVGKTMILPTNYSEYRVWSGAKARCFNPGNIGYRYYGGRGITMCDRWRDSFEAFFADMGPRPSMAHTLDRINNAGNYEPGNCRWATWLQQAANRRPPQRRQAA